MSAWGKSWGSAWGAAWGTLNQDAQTGRSGYWRLFFYQLQEQSLAKKEDPVAGEEEKAVSAIKKPGTKPKLPKSVPVELPSRPPYLFKPEPLRVPQQPDFLAQTWKVTFEIRALLNAYSVNVIKYTKDLEEDDEEEIELLLLVA